MIKQYKRIQLPPPVYRAVQFTGTNIKEIKKLVEGKAKVTIGTNCFYISKPSVSGYIDIDIGDYVVVDQYNYCDVLSESQFNKYFAEDNEGNSDD